MQGLYHSKLAAIMNAIGSFVPVRVCPRYGKLLLDQVKEVELIEGTIRHIL